MSNLPTAADTIDKHGGRVLVAGGDTDVLEGDWDHNFTDVLEFPSVEDAHAWYNDSAYEDIKPVRHDATEYANLVIVPEFSPGDLEG